MDKKVVIVGCGFAGYSAARVLGNRKGLSVTVIDRTNHYLFQPLLYQVATAGLSPSDITYATRALLSRYRNTAVRQEATTTIDLKGRLVVTPSVELPYDYLIVACGAQHAYFGKEEWEPHAPGLKTIEQATEIRNRILGAFEEAERSADAQRQKRLLTFVVVGGGATGVELAGAIADMAKKTFRRDFRNIRSETARVLLVEAGPRILAPFSEHTSEKAKQYLEQIGVEVALGRPVSRVDADGVEIGGQRIETATVLWAAGVQASELNKGLGVELDRQGRVKVGSDLSLSEYPEVFVLGDQAHCEDNEGRPYPALATVALQQGRLAARNIRRDLRGAKRAPFRYKDKGKAATIGKGKAVIELGKVRFGGFPGWILWLLIHILSLTGFENRILVLVKWAGTYICQHPGARLITSRNWYSYRHECNPAEGDSENDRKTGGT